MKDNNIKKIGIIGTGMIGTSLAVLTTGHKVDTIMLAVDEELKNKSEKIYEEFYDEIAQKGVFTEEKINSLKRYLSYSFKYEDFKDCELIFEAVIENLEIKHQIYHFIEENCPNIKAICSVSSAITVDELSSSMKKYKDKLVVTHPFFPPHMIPFFEIDGGTERNIEVIEYVKKVLEFLDRKPIVLKKSVPGFVGNRLQFALWREAVNIVEQGIADPEDIDTCLMYSFCPRYTSIGIYEHFDNGGLDLNYNVCKAIFPTLSNLKEVPVSVKKLVEKGELGVKTKKGFYDWNYKDIDEFKSRISEPYWRFFNWNKK